jgi:hypothetical protein
VNTLRAVRSLKTSISISISTLTSIVAHIIKAGA